MDKKVILFTFFIFIIFPLISAEIIVHTQPDSIYNLEDSLDVSMTVKSLIGATGPFEMNLICDGQEINFYKNSISLPSGGEKRLEASLIFTKILLGEIKGNCVIKGIFRSDYVLTNQFKLSDNIIINLSSKEPIFTPGTTITISGNAIKENGKVPNGFIDLEINSGDVSKKISLKENLNNGIFSFNVNLPKDMKAGKTLLKLNAYEKDYSGEITNKGFMNENIDVAQIPNNLEIISKNDVNPGEDFIFKIILHDQTGESISSQVQILLKDSSGKIIKQFNEITNKDLIFSVSPNELPSTWEILAESNQIKSTKNFKINEKREIKTEIINNTLIIRNVGNVMYEGEVFINIGEETLPIKTSLDVGESKEYKLYAPAGEYEVSIIEEGKEKLKQRTVLTGGTIGLKEKKNRIFGFFFIWIFILLVFGFVAYTIFKKGYKRTFLGYMPKFLSKKESSSEILQLKRGSRFTSRNPAIVSLSIKGEKQKSTVVCLKIKNFGEIQNLNSGQNEILQKIVNFAESNKAMVYDNQDHIFFIFAPIKTKTFKNESLALKTAQYIKKIMAEENRLLKQKLIPGISINNGEIIVKPELDHTKFASLGTFITTAKKIASISSDGEILFSKEVGNNLNAEIKAERFGNNEDIYRIKEIRRHNEESKKYIDTLVDKWKKEDANKKNPS